jgi:CheY-like chemotaxis protein
VLVQALRAIEKNPLDLVLLDSMMSGIKVAPVAGGDRSDDRLSLQSLD